MTDRRALLEARAAARIELERRRALSDLTLERLVTDQDLGAFPASPVQRSLCRAADGRSVDDLLTPERRAYHLGTEVFTPTGQPRTVVLRTGVRAGKSFIAAMALLKSILTCQFRRKPEADELPGPDGLVGIREGELVRALIVAPLLKLSRAPLAHLIGTMQASKTLASLLVKHGAESCVIRRPDGCEVTVELVAASSGGANLRSTYLAGCIFDEADFHDGEDGAVNLPDNFRAAATRMLPGAQIWIPSSPWSDDGPFHELFTAAYGRPGRAIAFHSSTRAMNPTLDKDDEEAERKRDPENAAREFDAVPLKTGSKLFFAVDALEQCIDKKRPLALERNRALTHHAGVDLGFRKNSSAIAIARPSGDKVEVAYYEEIRPEPGAPLKPSEVCKGFGQVCQRYGVSSMRGDSYYADAAHEHLAELDGAEVFYEEWAPTSDAQSEAFTTFRALMQEGRLILPDDPRLIQQIKGVRTKKMAGGKIAVQLPKQGWAHGDLLMAVVLACVQVRTGSPVGLVDMDDVEDFLPPARWGDARGY